MKFNLEPDKHFCHDDRIVPLLRDLFPAEILSAKSWDSTLNISSIIRIPEDYSWIWIADTRYTLVDELNPMDNTYTTQVNALAVQDIILNKTMLTQLQEEGHITDQHISQFWGILHKITLDPHFHDYFFSSMKNMLYEHDLEVEDSAISELINSNAIGQTIRILFYDFFDQVWNISSQKLDIIRLIRSVSNILPQAFWDVFVLMTLSMIHSNVLDLNPANVKNNAYFLFNEYATTYVLPLYQDVSCINDVNIHISVDKVKSN